MDVREEAREIVVGIIHRQPSGQDAPLLGGQLGLLQEGGFSVARRHLQQDDARARHGVDLLEQALAKNGTRKTSGCEQFVRQYATG